MLCCVVLCKFDSLSYIVIVVMVIEFHILPFLLVQDVRKEIELLEGLVSKLKNRLNVSGAFFIFNIG